MKPQPSENQLHASVAKLLDWMLLPPALYTTFPAGGYLLSTASAGMLKHRGLKAGMPDILVFYKGRCVGIELKTKLGRLSANQIALFQKLEHAGVHVYVCWTMDDVIEALQKEDFPLRKETDKLRMTNRETSDEKHRPYPHTADV